VTPFEIVAKNLADCAARLGAVLNPWGFEFEAGPDDQLSPAGPYGSGHFVRGGTRIGISCRSTLDNIYYEHSFVREYTSSRAIECFTIGHAELMRAVDHSGDCWLVTKNQYPILVAARDGSDPVVALIHDLSQFCEPILADPCDAFFEIMRKRRRGYSVE